MHSAALLGMLTLPALAAADGLAAADDPFEVAGGEDVEACGWATAVALLNDGQPFCTGTLVHPQVVLLAAHCIDDVTGVGDPTSIAFGEDAFTPIGEITPAFCGWHPSYVSGFGSEGFDVAYCVLTQAVELDIVPPLMGCDWDAMIPGAQTFIVGFGADSAILDPEVGWTEVTGVGTKRWARQDLEAVIDDAAYLLGDNAGGCPGDSGGPAMIEMPDGSWRVIGAASRIHPDAPPSDTNWCLYGTVYSTFAHVMPWLEQETGFDITPCHDADGTWNPDARCNEIPLHPWDPQSTSGTWQDGCAAVELNEVGALCGPPFEGPPPEPPPPEPPPPPPSTTGGPATTGPPSPMTSGSPPPDNPLPGGTEDAGDESSAGDGADLQGDGLIDRGCSCRSTPIGSGAWWLWLSVLPFGWRRRRSG